jgi:hypothetical protein
VSEIEQPCPVWRKSRYSNGQNNCVEIALIAESVGVRDSKNPAGPVLVFSGREWAAFRQGVVEDRYGCR